MNKLVIKQNTGLIELNVPGSVISKLVDIHKTIQNPSLNMLLEGTISIKSTDGVYQDDIDYLTTTRYPNLSITASKLYIKFADPVLKQILVTFLLSNSYSDGIGVTPALAMSVPNNSFSDTSFLNNTTGNINITSFNELVNFTNITTLTGGIFKNCTGLTSINLSNVTAIYGTSSSGVPFQGCTSLTNLGNNFKPVYLGAYNQMHLNGGFNGCTSLESIDLTRVNTIANNAFLNCSNLKYISGGQLNFDLSSLEYIGEQPFKGCNILDLIELNCPNLKGAVSNSQNLLKVGAFANIKSLTKIVDLGLVTHINNSESWSAGVFEGCSNLTEVTLPASLESIGKGAFKNCSSINKLTCLATTPPTINVTDGFIPSGINIYVPASSVTAYLSATTWSDYTINAISTT